MEAQSRKPVSQPVTDPLPSYWHVPKSPLASHTSSPHCTSISTHYDHIIIGSGISGTLIAHNLLSSNPSLRIVMLEAREACSGATGRNGGHTKAASYRTYLQHRKELGKKEALKIARLEYANIMATHALAKELAIDCENMLCNTVDLLYDQDVLDCGIEAIEALRTDAEADERKEGGMAWYKSYGKDEAMERFWAAGRNSNPTVKEDEELVGAFEYQAGRINAYRFTTSILERCVKKGLMLYTNTPVDEILPTTKVTDIDAEGPVYKILTQRDTFRTRSVIVATNGYTPYLLPSFQSAIVPLRGQITAQRIGKNTKLPSMLPTTYSFIHKSGFEYMIPRPSPGGEQHIIIGGGLGRQPSEGITEYGTIDDSSLNDSIAEYLHGSLIGYFGSDNWGETTSKEDGVSKRIIQEWTGIMGVTADERPYVGQVPGMPGIAVSAGFNGHGMALCLKSAEALAKMLTGRAIETLEWFPQSFLVSQERIDEAMFSVPADTGVPETGGNAVSQAE